MSYKTGKTIAAIICIVLALASGFFATIMWGLARMDTGIVSWTPQLVFAIAAPFLFLLLAARIFWRR